MTTEIAQEDQLPALAVSLKELTVNRGNRELLRMLSRDLGEGSITAISVVAAAVAAVPSITRRHGVDRGGTRPSCYDLRRETIGGRATTCRYRARGASTTCPPLGRGGRLAFDILSRREGDAGCICASRVATGRRADRRTVSARSLRDPQKRPPQKSLIGIDFCGERIRKPRSDRADFA
jgi:hypothetical protein